MRWVGHRLDAIWQSNPDSAVGKTLRAITDRTSMMMIYIVMALGILYSVTRLLYLPPEEFGIPLQPVLTFILAALWIGYILYSLHTLIAVDVAPDRIGKFSILVISGAIALSIYFLLPVDWLVSSANRALALLMGERDPGIAARRQPEMNSTIVWLQSTAIPSM
jgi:phosphatidylglycerophosphate synthase